MQLQKHEQDCLTVCLEEITGVPYDDIPEFFKMDPETVVPEYVGWLGSIDYVRVVSYCDILPEIVTKGFKYIAILRKPERAYSHAVVIEVIDEEGGYVLHDPKGPESEYTLKDLISVEYILSMVKVRNYTFPDMDMFGVPELPDCMKFPMRNRPFALLSTETPHSKEGGNNAKMP